MEYRLQDEIRMLRQQLVTVTAERDEAARLYWEMRTRAEKAEAEVERLRPKWLGIPEVAPGSYKNARGVLPWKPGDEPAEVTIRRMRDGRDSTVVCPKCGTEFSPADDCDQARDKG